MTCHCGKVALFRVGFDGYCKKHHAEAQRSQAAIIRAREAGASEYESWQDAIERAMRVNAARFRPNRRNA